MIFLILNEATMYLRFSTGTRYGKYYSTVNIQYTNIHVFAIKNKPQKIAKISRLFQVDISKKKRYLVVFI